MVKAKVVKRKGKARRGSTPRRYSAGCAVEQASLDKAWNAWVAAGKPMKGRLKGNVVNAFKAWNDCTKAEA